MTVSLASANTITLGNRVLQLRGLRMEHVRQGLLEQLDAETKRIIQGTRATPTVEQIEGQIDIVAAAVDDQISRADFDKLLNALAPLEGTNLLTSAISPILKLSGFSEGETKKPAGEEQSPAV